MINRQFIVLLVLLFSTNSQALKGTRGRTRQLQQDDIFDKGDSKAKDDKDDKTGKSEKTEKEDKKGKDKENKKEKKGCKKRPKTPKAPKESDEATLVPKIPLDRTETDGELWCEDESIRKRGNCAELQGGKLPKSDVVTGSLALEITSKKENAVEEMERKLKKDTTLSAVGCGGRRLQENVTDANVTEIFLLAVDIAGLAEKTENCTNVDSTDGSICTVMVSEVTIHYSGDAGIDQKVALFDSLTNTILTQAEGGDFDEIASVHFAEARITSNETEGNDPNFSTENSGGFSTEKLVGVLAAVAVSAVGAVFF